MLNRKGIKPADPVASHQPEGKHPPGSKASAVRRRFALSSMKRKKPVEPPANPGNNGHVKAESKNPHKTPPVAVPGAAPVTNPLQAIDLTEAIKTLLHLAQEHGSRYLRRHQRRSSRWPQSRTSWTPCSPSCAASTSRSLTRRRSSVLNRPNPRRTKTRASRFSTIRCGCT